MKLDNQDLRSAHLRLFHGCLRVRLVWAVCLACGLVWRLHAQTPPSAQPAATATQRLEVLVYPPLIYDEARTSVYRDQPTSLLFLCYPRGEQRITDLAATSRLEVDLPENLVPRVAAMMNGWKKDGGKVSEFASEAIERDGRAYRRYTVPLPAGAFYPALSEPLPGGMFGGIAHNLVNLLVQPAGDVPASFRVYWRVSGKYAASGEFQGEMMAMPRDTPNPRRIQLRSHAPLANLGHPREEIESLIAIYREIGVQWVDEQHDDGSNRGYRELWRDAGFSFYGGGGFMGTLMAYSGDARTASTNRADYAIGVDGQSTYGTDSRRYHGRIWCPTAALTPGRYPFQLNLAVIDKAVALGVTMLDADFEIHPWSHCFCAECRARFAEFAGLLPGEIDALPPDQIPQVYPTAWFKFRCEQTRILYARLRQYARRHYPGTQLGCNAILQHLDTDFGNLRHGFCDFAEDPRLLDDAVDYFLADTLTGSVYDALGVDAMRRTTTRPIISVAGCSYCVGFDPMVMAGRRMTANMTGDRYGYDRRADLLKLGMVHQAASGAAGIRFSVEEVAAAVKADEAAALLAQVEDWYLDGRRIDEAVEVMDLTDSPSPWLQDKSRVGGGTWRHFFKLSGSEGHYRAHAMTNGLLISLFNWDFHQDKTWFVRLPARIARDYHVAERVSNVVLRVGEPAQARWTATELEQGFPVAVPAAGMRLLLFTPERQDQTATLDLTMATLQAARQQARGRKPFDPMGWYRGTPYPVGQAATNGVKGAFGRLRSHP